ncbi:MAG: hypothetical protein HQL40_03965 [Alphaproteobacteria bacterium]|nr:hypothetical protein [Alphaproteobacteria bacterium]
MFIVGFSAAGIQSHIMESGQLRDIAAGSEVIEGLCNRDLDKCLEVVGARDTDVRIRAAGKVRVGFADKAVARRFIRLWSLVVRERAPGLRHAIALVDGDDADSTIRLEETLETTIRLPVLEPLPAMPLTMRSARTGKAAVREDSLGDDPLEAIDLSTSRRRDYFGEGGRRLLEARFGLPDRWRFTSDAAVLGGEGVAVAMVHADGTGFGQMFAEVGQALAGDPAAADILRALSQAVGEATSAAAAEACGAAFEDHGAGPAGPRVVLPMRPIVLGGDDLTVLLEARRALTFSARFLEAFERIGANRLDDLRRDFPRRSLPLPTHLTAAVGIAFTHAAFPAVLAHRLAEDICAWVKTHLRPIGRSGLAFHRVTASNVDHWDTVLDQELTGPGGARLTMAPYVTARDKGDGEERGEREHGGGSFPTIGALDELCRTARALPRGAWREILDLCRVAPLQADHRFQRMVEIGLRSDEATRLATIAMGAALRELAPDADQAAFWCDGAGGKVTPWADVAALLGLERRIEEDE